LGKYAAELVTGHEESEGPCGPKTPFGRLADLDAQILRIGTGALTIHHHVQELVDYPNLFAPGTCSLKCLDYSGNPIMVSSRVHRKNIPSILFLAEDTGSQKFSIHPSNFPLLYSGDREDKLAKDPQRQVVLGKLLAVRDCFEASGWLTKGVINGCKCELFRVSNYLDFAVREGKQLLQKYSYKYNLSDLEQLWEEGGYPS
jgi:aminoglycoside N3'-acetyltransferase